MVVTASRASLVAFLYWAATSRYITNKAGQALLISFPLTTIRYPLQAIF
jgi:hypothetical protein